MPHDLTTNNWEANARNICYEPSGLPVQCSLNKVIPFTNTSDFSYNNIYTPAYTAKLPQLYQDKNRYHYAVSITNFCKYK